MMMWGCPDAALIASTLRNAQGAGFNYEAGAATIEQPPAGFFRNHTDVRLGQREACWRAASTSLRRWRMAQLGWCDFLSTSPEPEAGQVVIARVSHLGFWSLQPSRIIAVEQQDRYASFAIRTLKGHDECGEERFEVEWLPSGEVRFRVRSYSRPAHLAGWLALPYVRQLQRRFGRESAQVMQSLT